MPKVPDSYIKKRFTHKSVLVSIPKDLLEILYTIIPTYKRSQLIVSLLKEFVSKHSQDPVVQSPKKPKTRKSVNGMKSK